MLNEYENTEFFLAKSQLLITGWWLLWISFFSFVDFLLNGSAQKSSVLFFSVRLCLIKPELYGTAIFINSGEVIQILGAKFKDYYKAG